MRDSVCEIVGLPPDGVRRPTVYVGIDTCDAETHREIEMGLIVFAVVDLILVMLIWLRAGARETEEEGYVASHRDAAYAAVLRRHRGGAVLAR